MKQSESDIPNLDNKTYKSNTKNLGLTEQSDLIEEEEFYNNFGEGTFEKRAVPGTGAKRISTKKPDFGNLNVNQSKHLSHMNQ